MQSDILNPEPEFLDGATTCLELIRRLNQADAKGDGDLPLAQFFALRDTRLAQILDTAGPVSNRAAGVISLLTELILDLRDDMLFADVGTWQPEALLSGAKRQTRRNDLLES
jgi:hypothetical protein